MTFQFRIWPIQAFDIRTAVRTPDRPRLIAHWQRGADGRLECRWSRNPN